MMSLDCKAETCPFWAPAVGFRNCSAMVKHLHGRMSYIIIKKIKSIFKIRCTLGKDVGKGACVCNRGWVAVNNYM